MSQSRRFLQLRTRCKQLRESFLPRSFSPVGTYTAREIDLARAYRLLVHAEIESYLEDRCVHTLTKALKGWKSKRKHSRALLGLMSFSDASAVPPTTLATSGACALTDRINTVATVFHVMVKNNHGIRAKNTLPLLMRVGLSDAEVDPALLAGLDTLGARRGDVAHNSGHPTIVKLTKNVPNPQDEFNAVTSILAGLAVLDRQIGAMVE